MKPINRNSDPLDSILKKFDTHELIDIKNSTNKEDKIIKTYLAKQLEKMDLSTSEEERNAIQEKLPAKLANHSLTAYLKENMGKKTIQKHLLKVKTDTIISQIKKKHPSLEPKLDSASKSLAHYLTITESSYEQLNTATRSTFYQQIIDAFENLNTLSEQSETTNTVENGITTLVTNYLHMARVSIIGAPNSENFEEGFKQASQAYKGVRGTKDQIDPEMLKTQPLMASYENETRAAASTRTRGNKAAFIERTNRFTNIDDGLVPFKYTSGQYQQASTLDIKDAVILCQKAYYNFSIFRNTIDLMTEFSCSPVYFTGANKKARDINTERKTERTPYRKTDRNTERKTEEKTKKNN